MRLRAVLPLLMFSLLARPHADAQGRAFPTQLERYMNDTVRLTALERQRLFSGEAVTRLLAADESKEVAILGAVWINAPMHRYIEAVSDIESFERGGGHYSWWSQRFGVREKNIGWRIDLVLASSEAVPYLRRAFIEPHVRGSDHCPVGVELDDDVTA